MWRAYHLLDQWKRATGYRKDSISDATQCSCVVVVDLLWKESEPHKEKGRTPQRQPLPADHMLKVFLGDPPANSSKPHKTLHFIWQISRIFHLCRQV
jgi:hypothetical protein